MFQVLLPTHESHILPTVMMLAKALENKGVPLVKSPLRWRPARAVAKVLGGLSIRHLQGNHRHVPVFCQLNHAWKNAFYPYVLQHPLVTFTFDCWPFVYDEWQEVFQLNRPQVAFISARKSVAEMQRRVPGIDFRWLPEAGDPAAFNHSMPLSHRPIDILEVGRSYPAYHNAICGPLASAQNTHQFPPPDKPIALTYTQAVKAIAEAKVVVCFPKSVTDPARAGGVETTTFRYFECIFSKSLMIGHCPEELISILGYNPVVEADMNNPAAQLLTEILPNIGKFQSFVDANYQNLIQKWTVHHQAETILSALRECAEENGKAKLAAA